LPFKRKKFAPMVHFYYTTYNAISIPEKICVDIVRQVHFRFIILDNSSERLVYYFSDSKLKAIAEPGEAA
jgi:hypothetical protein